MTTDATRTIRKGQYVMHHASFPPYRPMRVTQVEPSLTGRVMLRFASLRNAWVPATEYARPEAKWSTLRGWWVIKGRDAQSGETTFTSVPLADVKARYEAETA